MQELSMDHMFLGPHKRFTHLIDLRCNFSGWSEALAVPSESSKHVLRFLEEEILPRYGQILQITTNNGAVGSQQVEEYLKKRAVLMLFTVLSDVWAKTTSTKRSMDFRVESDCQATNLPKSLGDTPYHTDQGTRGSQEGWNISIRKTLSVLKNSSQCTCLRERSEDHQNQWIQPPLTFCITSSSSSSSPSFYSVDGHKTFPVCDLSLPSFSLLSFPEVDDYHLFLDLQAQVCKKLDVEEIIQYEPVICHCPEFRAIHSKETCLLDLLVPVKFLPITNEEWEQCLRTAIFYSLSFAYGQIPDILKTECFPMFCCLGDPAEVLNNYQDEISEEVPDIPLPPPGPPTFLVPLPKTDWVSSSSSSSLSSSSSSSSLLSAPKDTGLMVRTSWVWWYFCHLSDGNATVCQVLLNNGELCNTWMAKDKKTFSTSGMARHLKGLHKLSLSFPSVPSPSSSLP
ncbi:hypothetical protein HMI56_006684 [Coelomomyces lativittatus]|nr:hypothetical protein HMI56_006684 [Coelomomyces lativittatus]